MKRIIKWTLTALSLLTWIAGHAQNRQDSANLPDPEKFYEIRTSGGLVLDNYGSLEAGSGVFTAQKQENKESQVWKVIPSDLQGYVLIYSPFTEMSLDNDNGASSTGPMIQWTTEKSNRNQLWEMTANGDGTFSFKCAAGGCFLGYSSAGVVGEPVYQFQLDGQASAVDWIHSLLKRRHELAEEWQLSQCLFGEHLLGTYPDKVVVLVESEKSAVIGSAIFPGYVWLARSWSWWNPKRVPLSALPSFPAMYGWRQAARAS